LTFKPRNARAELPLDDAINALVSSDANPKEMGAEQRRAYQKQLSSMMKIARAKMAETSTKENDYDEAIVTAYIDKVLEDGFALIKTELSSQPGLEDAQRIKRWAELIGERVELSPFGKKQFKVQSLRLLRSNIAKATTLSDLRQAVILMIGPLEFYREYLAEREQLAADSKETMNYFGTLLIDIAEKDKLLAERGRVLKEILAVYSEDDSDHAVLRNIESAKKQHNLSDTEAAAWYGVSRRRLQTLREKLIPLDDEEDALLVRAEFAEEDSPAVPA
jgi:hypothetical protein